MEHYEFLNTKSSQEAKMRDHVLFRECGYSLDYATDLGAVDKKVGSAGLLIREFQCLTWLVT